VAGDSQAHSRRRDQVEQELGKVERERRRYVDAIGAGGKLSVLLDALVTRKRRRRPRAGRDRVVAPHDGQ